MTSLRMAMSMALACLALSAAMPWAQQTVSFKTGDGWMIHGEVHGTGDRGVVLVHGGRFTKESWRPQAAQLVRA